jgi:hypothetical protein
MALHGAVCTVCGDGNVSGNEQCDDGVLNSDTNPDAACRSNCERPSCESETCGGCPTEATCAAFKDESGSAEPWTLAIDGGHSDVGAAEFNRLFHESPHGIIKFVCAPEVCPDRGEMYYRRLTSFQTFDPYPYMVETWSSLNNLLGTDFNIFDTYTDALAGTNAWKFCDYDDSGIGFPRNCGPDGDQGGCQMYHSKACGPLSGVTGNKFYIEGRTSACAWTDGGCDIVPTSCAAVLATRPGAEDGIYTIAIAGTDTNVYCNMARGGWTFVNELGRSQTDINDLSETAVGGYHLPVYQIDTPFTKVLVQRVSSNWCDSWGRKTGHWVADSGASMGVQADNEFWTYYNNGGGHTWLRQSTSYLPPGTCNGCWVHPGNGNEYDTHGVTIESLETDGSVVQITFPSPKTMLKVGAVDAFLNANGGCDADGPVSYRVYTRST